MTLIKAEQQVEELLIQISLATGATMLLSKVFAVLFSEPRPLSLEELSQRTGYSLSSVSGAVKLLEQAGKVNRSNKPGTKKVYVTFNKNLVQNIHEHLAKALTTVIKPMQMQLPSIITDLHQGMTNADNKEKKQQLKDKIEWYECFLRQTRQLEEFFTKMEKEFKELEQRTRQ